jgi:hypothetical protein
MYVAFNKHTYSLSKVYLPLNRLQVKFSDGYLPSIKLSVFYLYDSNYLWHMRSYCQLLPKLAG